MDYDFQNPMPLPETMPLRADLTGADVAFSAAAGHLHKGGAYLDYYAGQCKAVPPEWQKRANGLFFKGGRLEDFGIRVRPGIDPALVRANLRWLLSSWGPKHEEKAATVGFALQCWCEEIKAEPTAQHEPSDTLNQQDGAT